MSEEVSGVSIVQEHIQQLYRIVSDLEGVLQTQKSQLDERGISLPSGTFSSLQAALQHIDGIGNGVDLLSEERDQFRSLADTAALINSTLDLTQVLNGVMDTIIELTGAQRGYLMLRDEDSGELTFRIARNMDRETLDEQEFEISRTIVNRVAESGEGMVTTNAPEDYASSESVVLYGLRSVLCVPLKLKDKVTGVVYADNRMQESLFDESDRDLLEAFADQAAVAIQNAQLFASVSATLDAISEMKNLQDNIFASISSGVITTDTAYNITLINQAAETILNLEHDIAAGVSLSDVIPAPSSNFDNMLEIVRKEEQQVIGMELDPQVPVRGQINLSLNLSPLRDAQAATQGVAIVLNDLTEEKRREAQLRGVERYLPKEVVAGLTNVDALKLGGTRQEISILFSDIRGFSTFSEQVSPERLVEVINTYFTIAGEAIHMQEGVIDKFMGDAVMALFNPSIRPQTDHALRAVRAALAMRFDYDEYNETLKPEDRLQFGIGVHTGDAVTGNIGSPDRLAYSALGDSVNLAKRLQEVSGPGQIIIGDATYKQVKKKVEVIKLDPIQVKGRSEYTQVYELVGVSD